MGIGEPLANYDNVLEAIRIINADWGMNIGARKITVSTVGLPKQIRQLADEDLQINLAISLHAPTDALRRQLIPWAKQDLHRRTGSAVGYYFEKTGREVTLEYLLLGGVNDRPQHAADLANLCRQMRCNVNLIRYNPVPGLDFERPSSAAAHHFVEQLRAAASTSTSARAGASTSTPPAASFDGHNRTPDHRNLLTKPRPPVQTRQPPTGRISDTVGTVPISPWTGLDARCHQISTGR